MALASDPGHIPTTIKDVERVTQRRAQIADHATELFLERGFHGTSIRDIAQTCGLNVAGLYMYVRSKEDILFLVGQQLIRELNRQLGEIDLDSTPPVAALEQTFQAYCAIVDRYRRHITLLYRELGNLPPERQRLVLEAETGAAGRFQEILKRGIDAGVFRDVDPQLVSNTVVFVAHMWALRRWSLTKRPSIDTFVEQQLDLLRHAIIV